MCVNGRTLDDYTARGSLHMIKVRGQLAGFALKVTGLPEAKARRKQGFLAKALGEWALVVWKGCG
jgi:hypothetical protein